jgi:hypothetical protein
MDGLSEGRTDTPLFALRSLPLPITHSDFYYSRRLLEVSARQGRPLNVAMVEAATRRAAEMVEKTLIGVEAGVSYGYQNAGYGAHDSTTKSNVWGYLTFPRRLTSTSLTAPTGSNPNVIFNEWIALRESMYAQNFYGPFVIYTSTDWDQYLDQMYAFTNGSNWAVNPSNTLREQLLKIEGIETIRRLDYLTAANSHAFTLLMIQMTSDVVQAIEGMQFTTVQWESKGGMQINFKIMGIMVPLIKHSYTNQCGILHARTA